MLYLVSGSTASLRRHAAARPGRLGFLLAPRNRHSVASVLALGLPWAADNGAYSGLDPSAFRRMLARVAGAPGCLFVACPDAVGDARATLAMFRAWRGEVALSGQPVAFVGQDGAEGLELPWDDFAAYFVGGSTRWKLSAASAGLCAEARRRGKWLHVGRVNSLRRMRAALDLGAGSVDGSSASMFGEKYLPTYCGWLDALHAQPTLFGGTP